MHPEYHLSFARRIGKSLSPSKKNLLTQVLPDITPNAEKIATSQAKNIILEIGCGGGEYIIQTAASEPQNLYVGCEPYLNGVVSIIEQIQELNLKNIFIWPDDVRLLLDELPASIFDRICIFFPDPWPKTKQHKKRLINNYLLDILAPKLKPGADILTATDDRNYAKAILLEFLNHQSYSFDYLRDFHQDFTTVETKYKSKAKANLLKPYYLRFIKNN